MQDKLRIKRVEMEAMVEAAKLRLEPSEYKYLLRVARSKAPVDLTPMEVFDISVKLSCFPNDLVFFEA